MPAIFPARFRTEPDGKITLTYDLSTMLAQSPTVTCYRLLVHKHLYRRTLHSVYPKDARSVFNKSEKDGSEARKANLLGTSSHPYQIRAQPL